MAKKRPHDGQEAIDTTIHTHVEAEQPTDQDGPASMEPIHPLMDEVQTFMNLRDELARKLAAEIEATELKLAELKKTAASLFPQSAIEPAEDKKAKKPKPKPAKEEKVVAEPDDESESAAA